MKQREIKFRALDFALDVASVIGNIHQNPELLK